MSDSATIPREIELKFDIDPTAVESLEGSLLRLGGEAHRRAMISTYYDDADQSLHKAGFTLRVRQIGDVLVQTVKSDAGGALFSRGEWEEPLTRNEPDLDLAALTPLGSVIDDAGPLRAAFFSRIDRLERTIAYGGGRIEVALDKGEVEADGGRRAPVCQLELELKAGEPALLFQLARTLAVQTPLRLSFETKAGQGYGLLNPAAASVKSRSAAVSGGLTAGDAFQAVARSALRQIVANERILSARRAPAALHQLRVGLRRLRTALSLFKSVTADDRYMAMKTELKWLSAQLDEVRDTDVFTAETYQPAVQILGEGDGLAGLGKRLKQAQTKGYDHALKALKSRRGLEMTLLLAEWIEAGAWIAQPAAHQDGAHFAEGVLARLDRRIRKAAPDLTQMTQAERHGLRIQVKKLRYGVEFFAGLYGEKRTRAFTDRLRRFQDTLGQLNDIAVARRTAAALAVSAATPDVAYAAGLVTGLRGAGQADLLADAAKQYERLQGAKRPW